MLVNSIDQRADDDIRPLRHYLISTVAMKSIKTTPFRTVLIFGASGRATQKMISGL